MLELFAESLSEMGHQTWDVLVEVGLSYFYTIGKDRAAQNGGSDSNMNYNNTM